MLGSDVFVPMNLYTNATKMTWNRLAIAPVQGVLLYSGGEIPATLVFE